MFHKLLNTLTRVGINGFLLGLFAAIFLAWWFPEVGASSSVVPWKPIISIGIALIFFFYGVKLDPVQLLNGLKNWKLHLLIQLSTFLIFPAIVWIILPHLTWIQEDFKLGISYLSVLPSTVSASVVMVSIARGDLSSAIFNASISSLLGIVITPAWMGILTESSIVEIDFLPSLGELSFKVLLPVVVGLSLHRILFPKIQQHLKKLKYVDQTVIMMIVFTSFSESFSKGVFSTYTSSTLVQVALTMLAFFILIWILLDGLCRLLNFSLEEKITVLFCGSKKSLVHGVVIGKVIFPDPAILGLVILPVMLYHIQQLIVGSILAGFFGRRKEKKAQI